MLGDKRWEFTWVGIILLWVILLGIPAVYAGDMEPNPADVAAAEAQKAYEQLLGHIEASRFTVVDDLVDRFATDKETAEELRATLDSANATKLAEIVQKANSLDDIATILTGKTQEELTKEILALGDLDKDYVFTPVRPCRIVDTRIGGGGVFFPGQVREFFVYGDTTAQGGANCPSPRGEPRGVHINVTAVPQSGQGNFRAYPANVSAPNASLVNYKAGVQNIANAASVKTHFQLGTGGLKIQNRVGTSHLVVDILGYYHEIDEDDFKVRFAGSRTGAITELPIGGVCTNYSGGEVTIFAPGPGMIKVEAEVGLYLTGHEKWIGDLMGVYIGTDPSDCTQGNSSQGYNAMYWELEPSEPTWGGAFRHQEPLSVSRVFRVTTAGTKTYYLNGRCLGGYHSANRGFYWGSMKAFYYPDR